MIALKNAALTTLAIGVLLASVSLAPASAADERICSHTASREPSGAIGTAWHRLGGANGPLGCPTSSQRDARQSFEHGSISQPKADPQLTLATYLRDGRIHIAVTSLGRAIAHYQVALERSASAPTYWNFDGGSAAAFVADMPEGIHSAFHVKLFACQTIDSVFATASLVCDRSDDAVATSAPLELTMDETSPRSSPTGAVALRH